uniref:Protein TsetseEP domain-containing protein n=1 Tax=Timema monikensis TaxID=170555 RepID=A0A7R9HUH4_9NEOP|nr:unnamed protein product [Timema monikensis]
MANHFILVTVVILFFSKVAKSQDTPLITLELGPVVQQTLVQVKSAASGAVSQVMNMIDQAQEVVQTIFDRLLRSTRDAPPKSTNLLDSFTEVTNAINDVVGYSQEVVQCVEGKTKNAGGLVQTVTKAVEGCIQGGMKKGMEAEQELVQSAQKLLEESLNSVFGAGVINECIGRSVSNVTHCLIRRVGGVGQGADKLLTATGNSRYVVPDIFACVALRVESTRNQLVLYAKDLANCLAQEKDQNAERKING